MYIVVSIVSYPFLPAKFGGQKGIALFYKFFSQKVNLLCVSTKKNDPAEADGYKVLNILSNSPLRYTNLFYFFTLRKIIKQHNAQYLLLEHPYYGWLALLLKWFCGVKLIVHSHNIEALRWKSLGKWWWKIMWQYEKTVHQNADLNFFITDDDKAFAEKNYKLAEQKCTTITYGIEWDHAPSTQTKEAARKTLCELHQIDPNKKILLFNGAFDYKPNKDALYNIAEKINPLLLQQENFNYTILICGKNIPEDLVRTNYENIQFIGFVDDINLYFLGADIFLNPLADGGGIKTKLVEALGNNMNAVSTENGAIGVVSSLCNGKLQVVPDKDWEAFANTILNSPVNNNHIGTTFYEHFYWGNIANKAAATAIN